MAAGGARTNSSWLLVVLVGIIAVLLGIIYDNKADLTEAYVQKAISFVENNKHLKTYSNEHIGWLARETESRNVTDAFLKMWGIGDKDGVETDEALAQLLSQLPSAGRVTVLIFPGLMTQWYP
jgi:hypothetical protein